MNRRLRAAGGSPLLIWLQLEPAAVLGRLRARGARRDLSKLADPSRFLAELHEGAPAGPHLVVNAEAAAAEVVEEILAAMRAAAG